MTSQWTVTEKNIIEAVKNYPIVYKNQAKMSRTKYLKEVFPIWMKVSEISGIRIQSCKVIWNKIRSRYAVLKIMISSGCITEDFAWSIFKLRKYLEGDLDFLDPHVEEIPKNNSDYNFIFKKINSQRRSKMISPKMVQNTLLFKQTSKANSEQELNHSDVNYLMNKLEMAILDSMKNIDVSRIKTSLQLNMTSSDEDSDEDHNSLIKDVAANEIDTVIISEDSSSSEVVHSEYNDITDKLYETEKVTNNVANQYGYFNDVDPLKAFLMRYDVRKNYAFDIKEYMKDLSEVLCQKLAYDKRKTFLSKVDLLVSRILEAP